MQKYQTEFKLEVVKSFLAGEGGATLLARQWSVPEEKLRTWVSHFRSHGIDGLRPTRSSYSEQFKLQVLSRQDREQLSSRQVAAIYDIRNPNQVVVWRRRLDEGGIEALASTKQERPRMNSERHRPSPPAPPAADPVQPLRDENERLRAEVAYLKNCSLDPVEEISCAYKAQLITGLRQHHKLADLLRIASLARSTFYYHQRQLVQRAASQSDLQAISALFMTSTRVGTAR